MDYKRIILIAAFVVYLLSAFFNTGYYHYDEHFQLIEFADLKTGHNKPSDLAWEYAAQIRPAAQPALAYLFLSIFRAISVTDPYVLMTILRILSAILALVIITYFVKKTEHLVKDNLKTAYMLMAYFLWFLPFVNIRFSSETYSGLSFLLAVALLYSKNAYKWLLIGCLLGLSFIFRFQTAFMSLGLILWLIMCYKIRYRQLFALLGGGLTLILIGICVDYWFYGEWIITFYNYYLSNIVNDVASDFGVLPWYYYISDSVMSSIVPIGIIIWICLIIQGLFNKRGFLCWILLPFLFIHSMIPHKELRFLFPIFNLLPLTIILSVQYLLDNDFTKRIVSTYAMKIVFAICIIINLFALTIATLSPADNHGRMNIMQVIQNKYKNSNITLNVVEGNDPYHPIPVNQNFYRNNHITTELLDSTSDRLAATKNSINLMVIKRTHIKRCRFIFKANKLVLIDSGIPQWITDIKMFFGRQTNSYYLYEIVR